MEDIKPGQTGLEWLQSQAQDRMLGAQNARQQIRPQIDAAIQENASAPGVDPQLQEAANRASMWNRPAGEGPMTFGTGLANANSAYQQTKLSEAQTEVKRRDALRQARINDLQQQEALYAKDEQGSMAALAKAKTTGAMASYNQFKIVPGVGQVDNSKKDKDGNPVVVNPSTHLPELYAKMVNTATRNAENMNFGSAAEKEAWIKNSANSYLAKLIALTPTQNPETMLGNEPPDPPAIPAPGGATQGAPVKQAGVTTPQVAPAAQGVPQGAAPQTDFGASKFAGFLDPTIQGNKPIPGSLKNKNADKVAVAGQSENASQVAKFYNTDVIPKADAAREMMTSSDMLLNMKNLPWGKAKSWTVEVLGPVADALRGAGITDGGALLDKSIALNSAAPIINAMRNNILMLARGVQTEGDATRALDQIANMKQPQEAAMAMLKLQKAVAQRTIDRAEMFDAYSQGNNGLFTGAPQRWQAYASKTPLFTATKDGKVAYESEYVKKFMTVHPKSSQAEAVQAWREVANAK